MTSESWYCLQSKPNKESFLYSQLLARGIKAFYPRLRVKPVNPRARKVRAYFPGYVFAQFDLRQVNVSSLHWMPGAIGLVSFDGEPACVQDSLIHAIRGRVDQANEAGGERLGGLKQGERVLIQAGPFKGHEAIFDTHISGDERVRVLLKLMRNRQLPLELSGRQIERKTQPL